MSRSRPQQLVASPLNAIDKSLALMPLMHLMIYKSDDMEASFDEFIRELEHSKNHFSSRADLDNRSLARLAFLVSSLMLSVSDEEDKSGTSSPSSIINYTLDRLENLSSTSTDFQAAIPLENGLWGIEVAALVACKAQKSDLLKANMDKIKLELIQAINEISEILREKDEFQIARSKNAIAKFIAGEMNTLLTPAPKTTEELDQALEAFHNVVSVFFSLLKTIHPGM